MLYLASPKAETMIDAFGWLADTSHWPPRWVCGEWSYRHGWTHITADLAIMSAYYFIPAILFVMLVKTGLQWMLWNRVGIAFILFIFSCGTGHLIDAMLFWVPFYRLFTLVKVFTAVISWGAFFVILYDTPAILAAVKRRIKTE